MRLNLGEIALVLATANFAILLGISRLLSTERHGMFGEPGTPSILLRGAMLLAIASLIGVLTCSVISLRDNRTNLVVAVALTLTWVWIFAALTVLGGMH